MNYYYSIILIIPMYFFAKHLIKLSKHYHLKYLMNINIPQNFTREDNINKFYFDNYSVELRSDGNNHSNLQNIIKNLDEKFVHKKLIQDVLPFCKYDSKGETNIIFHDENFRILLKIIYDGNSHYHTFLIHSELNYFFE